MSDTIKEKIIKKIPYIDTDNCAGCSVCIENCPKECLKLSEPKFHGDIRIIAIMEDINNCVGCGMCEKVCPIGACVMILPNGATI